MFKDLQIRRIFYITLLLFVAAVLFGYFYTVYNYDKVIQSFNETFGFVDGLQEMPNSYIFIFIFLNNTIKSLLAIFLGIAFGIFPIYFIAANGYLVGLILAISVYSAGLKYFLAGVLPHGILEIFAIVYASSLGIWLGWKYFRKVRLNKHEEYKEGLKYSWRAFCRLVFPMLLVAALIEVYITPFFISMVQ